MIKLRFRCPITFNLKVCDIINKGINSVPYGILSVGCVMLNLIFFQFLDEVAKIQEQAIIEEQKRLKAEQDAKQRKLYTRKRTETEQSAG